MGRRACALTSVCSPSLQFLLSVAGLRKANQITACPSSHRRIRSTTFQTLVISTPPARGVRRTMKATPAAAAAAIAISILTPMDTRVCQGGGRLLARVKVLREMNDLCSSFFSLFPFIFPPFLDLVFLSFDLVEYGLSLHVSYVRYTGMEFVFLCGGKKMGFN